MPWRHKYCYQYVYTFFHFYEVSVLLASLSHFLQLENDAVAEKELKFLMDGFVQYKGWAHRGQL
jgi:hypothetical protein